MSIRISYTANNKYQDSPRAYYLHYILKLREEKIGSALPFGSAIDDALNYLLLNKDKSNVLFGAIKIFIKKWNSIELNGKVENLRTTDKVKFYKTDLDIPKNMLSRKDLELMEKVTPQWVSLRRKGIEILKAYYTQIIPHLKEVLAVQEFIEIKDSEGKNSIIGYMDLVAKWELNNTIDHHLDKSLERFNGKTIIFDNKTTSIKYKDDSVKESGQLGTYTEYYTNKFTADAEGYIVMPKKFRINKTPQIPISVIIDNVSSSTISHQFREYEDTINGIKLGNFPCTGNCKKSPFGCCYSKFCETEGKNTEGLVEIK